MTLSLFYTLRRTQIKLILGYMFVMLIKTETRVSDELSFKEIQI